MSRHQPVCEMPGLLSRFFIYFIFYNYYYYYFFDPDVLYNLENENEPLASMAIDHPVLNNTNNSFRRLKLAMRAKY